MGKYAFASGALVSIATMCFVDGMMSLDSLPFPVVVPYLLSLAGFFLMSLVDPFMLSSSAADDMLGGGAAGAHSSSSQHSQLHHRATFVFGTALMLISSAVALTLNGVGNDSAGCALGGVESSWPGFSLVFQGWCWLAATVSLYYDKCYVARGSFDSIFVPVGEE